MPVEVRITYFISNPQDTLKFIESKQAEIQENRGKIIGKRESMLKKQTELEQTVGYL